MWFALTAGLLLLLAGAWLYNRLIAERNLARQGFADIDVQLKRRADLVPQLGASVVAAAVADYYVSSSGGSSGGGGGGSSGGGGGGGGGSGW